MKNKFNEKIFKNFTLSYPVSYSLCDIIFEKLFIKSLLVEDWQENIQKIQEFAKTVLNIPHSNFLLSFLNKCHSYIIHPGIVKKEKNQHIQMN